MEMNAWELLPAELRERLQNARDDYERVDIANEFAWENCLSIPRAVAVAAGYAQSLAERLGYERGRMYSLRNRAALFFFTSDAEQALAFARTALRWFEVNGDLAGLIPTLLVLGGIHMRLARPDRAYEQFSRALQLAEEGLLRSPNDFTLQVNWAAAYANIGNVYIALGQVERGLRYLSEAYRRQVELQDLRGLGITAANIAGAYVQLGRLEEAKPFMEQSIQLLRETQTTYMLATALSNMGHLAALQHRWDEAQRYQEEALKLQREIGDELGEAVTLATIAVLRFHRGDTVTAFHDLHNVLRQFRQLRDVSLEMKLRRELGDLHVAVGDFQAALQHYHIGLQLAQRHGLVPWEMEFARIFAKLYEDKGEPSRALEYYKRYWTLYERLLGQRRQQALTVMEKELEIERLRYERELYRLRNEELSAALGELERQRAEVERAHANYRQAMEERFELVSILSHELRNLVGGIMTNAELLLSGLERLERSVVLQALDHILRAAEHLRDELHLLSRWQTLESHGTKHCYQVDDLLELVRQLVSYYERELSHKRISVAIDTEEEPFRVPLDWGHTQEILANYLLNAIKYSPKGARIRIRLRRTVDGGARVAVEDEGVGIPATELPKLFKRLGRAEGVRTTAGEPSIGLGLYIVRWLANRMRCRVWCESCPGKGSIFYLQIPFRRGEGPYFDTDPEPEEWQYLRADYPTYEEGEAGYRPRPGWTAYFPDDDRLAYGGEQLSVDVGKSEPR